MYHQMPEALSTTQSVDLMTKLMKVAEATPGIVHYAASFVLGVLPLALATGAGAFARNTIKFAVLGGMLASTSISISIVPVLFVLFTRFSYGKKELAYLQAHHAELLEKEKRVEDQSIDPELEYDFTHAGDKKNPSGQPG